MKEYKIGKLTVQVDDETKKEIVDDIYVTLLGACVGMGVVGFISTLIMHKKFNDLSNIVNYNAAVFNEAVNVINSNTEKANIHKIATDKAIAEIVSKLNSN